MCPKGYSYKYIVLGIHGMSLMPDIFLGIFNQNQAPLIHFLKGLRHDILSFFDHRQNYLEIERNLKIMLHEDGKTPKT